ncbi:MAG: endonuclease/exonuclease/phosphatase family protein [Cyanobacteria bacterium REEB67]|nr:endonuclease/exonuclease/phosphatase family protein [Cyanobacteria bacterium REEB67]
MEIARERKADIVCFCEIENGWFKRIDNTFTDYPYKALFPHFGGLGFVSKFPIVSWTVKEGTFWHRPRLYAEVRLKDGRILNLLVAHPTIPVYKDVFDCRNQDFSFFAGEFAARANPKILVGDLNCSPWSYYFQKLLEETGLNDSEVGFGPQPTWSPGGKLIPLLPIDHFLVSKDFVVADHHIERFAGADHRLVFVDLWLKPKSNDRQAMPSGMR